MKKTLATSILVLLVMTGINNAADNWVKIAETPEGIFYVDKASVEKEGTQMVVWLKETLKQPVHTQHHPPKTVTHTLNLIRYYCGEGKFEILQEFNCFDDCTCEITHMGFDTQIVSVAPDSIQEQLINYVCSGQI